MNKLLATFIIIGLLLPHVDPGRTKGPKSRKDSGNTRSYYKHPSGPRDDTEPRQTRGIKRVFYEAVEKLRDWSRPAKRARLALPEVDLLESPSFQLLPPDIDALERKWNAVLEFPHLRGTGAGTNEALDEIGERYEVGTFLTTPL